MKKLLLIVFLFILCNSYAQNLVLNPSFENFSPRDSNQIYLFVCDIDNWFEPYSQPFCTDEYYNRNAPNTSTSWALTQQEIRTGDGMIAISVFRGPTDLSIYREYAETKLGTPLINNKNYCISYYVSLCSRAKYAIDGLCACFSSDSLMTSPPDMLIYCNSNNLTCNSSITNDTLNWTKISLNYYAIGGEQYLTIGNFKTNNETNYTETNYPNFGELAETYYFIDDVAVYECNTPEYPANIPDKMPCKGETVTLGSPTRPQYLYEWKDAAGNIISTEGAITFVADTPTYYVLKQKDFKFDETTDTCFITVEPFCLHIPNVITPNNDGINDFFVIDGGSELTVDLQLFNRWGKLVYHSKHYQNNWPVNDIADGVYFYIIKATSVNGEVREYQGSVSVLR